MRALIVLILGSNPPEGTIKYGFKSEAECKVEALVFCRSEKRTHHSGASASACCPYHRSRKANDMNDEEHQPIIMMGGDPEDWGLIPSFLDLDDPRPAREQFNERYVAGWNKFEGFTFDADQGTLNSRRPALQDHQRHHVPQRDHRPVPLGMGVDPAA